MSNGPDREADTPPVSEPSQPKTRQAAPSEPNDAADAPRQRGSVPLKSTQSLERLRERVKKAARELERLRTENAALTARLRRLETQPSIDLDGTVLAFDEDPDVLRDKVEGFIRAIDAYLARETSG